MANIKTIVFRSFNPEKQRQFYCDVLGMTEFSDGSVGYGGEQATLVFNKTNAPYEPGPNDLYWKIALSVPNIELACRQLVDKGITVGTPEQFQDIGYLAHFTDPEGFTIELIEHWFKGQRQDEAIEPDSLGGGVHINLLTLRTANIDNIIELSRNWGMKLLSIQPVENYNFTLYFFAFTSDTPPSSDLQALENRAWLYQRKYTVLEIQHRHSHSIIRPPAAQQAGYAGAVFASEKGEVYSEELRINSIDEN